MMKVFTCNDHNGFYPVGAASVIVAENEHQAKELLTLALVEHGLKPDNFTLVELDTTSAGVTILLDGEY